MSRAGLALLAAFLLGAAPDRLAYLGVNLSGAEFGIPDGARHRYDLGTPGRDYTFPTRADIDGAAKAGFNIVRLPFAWERLQPQPNGALDAAYLAGLDEVVRDAAERDVAVIVEPANQGYGYGGLVGSPATPDAVFADLWRRVAAHFLRRPGVMFGLMNEPHDQTPADWLHSAQAAIDAIRATGARQEILVPGTFYAGGAVWVARGNAAEFADHITDPAHDIAFEVHQYNDADGSGRSAKPVSPTIGAERLAAVTDWAERGGKRLFLAEFGAGSDPDSVLAMRNELLFVQAHRRVWQGAAVWGGGPWWPDGYPLRLEADGPQMEALRPFMPGKIGRGK